MAANCPLAVYDQASSKYVGTFDGNRDGRRHIAAAEVVVGPHHDAFAAMYVHRIVCNLAAQFSAVILEDRGWHSWFLALVDSARRDRNGCVHDV